MKSLDNWPKRSLIRIKSKFNSRPKVIMALIFVVILIFGGYKIFFKKTAQTQYQTTAAFRGTLINSVTASGNITTGGSMNISTNINGVVKQVYVKVGDKVTKGQKIAEISADQDSLRQQTSAWASYLSAKSQLESANVSLWSLDSAMWAANQKFINDAAVRGLAVTDPTYVQEHDDWLAAEAKYKNQQLAIQQAQASLSNAWYAYQQYSPNITAPMAGVIINLKVAVGLTLSGSSSSASSNSSNSPQVIGTVKAVDESTQAEVNISEIDSVNVKPGQPVTLTIDALPDKSFTGKVLLIDTSGVTSSGVTSYPATIKFDTNVENAYPNMAVTAKIITQVKNDIILIPSAAIQTTNGQTTVRTLKDNQPVSVLVETGGSNDTQTEITTGVNEGDEVITNVIASSTSQSSGQGSSTSPFGAFGVRIGGGGNTRFEGR